MRMRAAQVVVLSLVCAGTTVADPARRASKRPARVNPPASIHRGKPANAPSLARTNGHGAPARKGAKGSSRSAFTRPGSRPPARVSADRFLTAKGTFAAAKMSELIAIHQAFIAPLEHLQTLNRGANGLELEFLTGVESTPATAPKIAAVRAKFAALKTAGADLAPALREMDIFIAAESESNPFPNGHPSIDVAQVVDSLVDARNNGRLTPTNTTEGVERLNRLGREGLLRHGIEKYEESMTTRAQALRKISAKHAPAIARADALYLELKAEVGTLLAEHPAPKTRPAIASAPPRTLLQRVAAWFRS